MSRAESGAPSVVLGSNLVFTNITSTFTGIGYVVLDVNGLVLSTEQLYGLRLRQVPMQTVRDHFFYVVQNLAASALHDIRFYYELTGDPWIDLVLKTLDDGSFVDYSRFTVAAEEDRIALVLTTGDRVSLVEYCHSVGLYVGVLSSLVFVYPYSNCNVLKPSETLARGIAYEGAACTAQRQDADACTPSLCDFLAMRGFTADSMNAAFMENSRVYVFDAFAEEVDEDAVRSMLRHNLQHAGEGRLYFDGRIYYGKRRICAEGERKADRSIFSQAPGMPWGGKDLDLVMPPIPDRPNLKHLANIRKSALSMYDRAFQYSTVPDAKRGGDAPKKVSAKMQRIMDENAARIRSEKEKAANAWLRGFYTNYSKMASLSAKKTYIENIRMDSEYINNKLSLLKIELYMDIWRLEQRGTAVDEKVLVPLYLSCLSFVEKNCAPEGRGACADRVELEFVLNKLIEAHFEATVRELVERHGLHALNLAFKTGATSAPNDVDLYFQLKCAGDHLKRTLGTRRDRRVPFDPDKWQVDLLDAVDANKSAIVAAPTSSGKTFICFYAIEKVLKSSDTDVVVFCLPTKALANQVSADIYARFNPKSCRTALQGTLMADRCTDPFNCQVLITIPAMLESLMASRGCGSIRYIIIDEVHKINDESIGLSIERIIHLARCPLLLLSATIGNLDSFYGWFRAIEERKGTESVLITHSERFCELKPYVYRSAAHPDLSSLAVGAAGADRGSTGSLVPLNCMFAYSFSHLKEFGFSDDISFLPEELLNLYYYIYLVLAPDQKRLIKKLAPKRFFKSNIICKADTREYQRHLLTTFQNWVREGTLTEQQVKEVYNMLVGQTLDAFPLVSTEEYLTSSILDLLCALRDRDMLPVIVFNTDREFITRLAKTVYQELENRDLRKRRDKMAERLKKENKRNRDNEKTRDSWIDDSIMSEQAVEPESRDIRYTFLDQVTKLTDAEIREELSDVRGTPRFATDMVYRGIGIHHAAMERKYRSAVEILFRKKHVRVLFATETLALGINMPCRTVVFAGDSLALDPMNYKQMAGRAGRRGYDTLGNVVFMGIPRGRVQNLMVSLLPQIQGPYTFSNTSLVSFDIESSLVRNPLLGSTFLEGRVHANAAGDYTFNHFSSEEKRRELVDYQKSVYPFIYPACYLWDLYVSNRCEDPAIFIFGLMFHLDKLVWDQESFIRTVAHLFEVRPCAADTVLEPMPAQCEEFLAQVNSIYLEDIRHFYSPQLRTLSRLRGEPLHYIKSFLFHPAYPKNSYVLDFFRHGSAGRISVRNKVSEGELWQSLYNIDYMLSSFIKMIETHCGPDDARLRKLKIVYATLHGKFREIFA